jgi:hypothetical protein
VLIVGRPQLKVRLLFVTDHTQGELVGFLYLGIEHHAYANFQLACLDCQLSPWGFLLWLGRLE